MQTRCPHCQTRFRVTTEQLKLRQGQVRCGACHAVFDALDSLSDESLVYVPPVSPAEAEAPPAMLESQPQPDGTVMPQPEAVPVEPVIPLAEIEAAANEANEPEPVPATVVEPEPVQESLAETPVVAEECPAVPVVKPARRWPWVLGSLVLLLTAAAQLAYFFRVELAVVAPALRPVLVASCELLDCDLPRPRKPEQVGIETSDLAPEGNGLVLTALLKNRAPFEQEYPHLELTLTDTQDEALVRKILTPADYLPAGQDAVKGFAARGEVAIRLALTTDNVPAVGYRLYLFYP